MLELSEGVEGVGEVCSTHTSTSMLCTHCNKSLYIICPSFNILFLGGIDRGTSIGLELGVGFMQLNGWPGSEVKATNTQKNFQVWQPVFLTHIDVGLKQVIILKHLLYKCLF